ncbi:PilZ domain-containing protein [Jiella sp. MQZ9-1]|uniref:PilZ domain-containing protein n=1 Tax=Jiella flava TaxID=2816857 RepID=A0A939G2R1_9HYPH|nr:PilZ domain-containing protein [Jiella flava]MBO0664483.1 PilZ domain-containing protein [Jiella flava]MCD2473118.1 PilZ domain-containing protein [Jiella flava]
MTTTSADFDGGERRAAPRMRVLKRAKVIFNNGYSTFDCIVRNISATGALLTIDDSVHLPKEFRIRIGEEQSTRLAELVYRRSMFAGIRFVDAAKSQTAQPAVPAVAGPSIAPGIRRIVPETLPQAVTMRFAWYR